MCGIAGVIDRENTDRLEAQLRKMIDIMEHRGPDEQGLHVDGPVGLGHRRLSVIDLSNGQQPMSNLDETVWISFNGEVYNFLEIRKDLEKRGRIFKTNCDTEVIIYAYEEYGEACVKRFRGMFAFCIWDSRKKRLFFARDRLGKKPLYYYDNGARLVFASEIKAVLQADSVPREVDASALKDYLTYLYVPFPKTIFKNIFKLPPAHIMIVQLDETGKHRTSTEAYWDLEYKPDDSLSETDWMEGISEKLYDAVKIRLVSDVPLGAFLSGGIDSSSIVAMMSQMINQPVKTFSIGFEESDFSELKYARMVADIYRTDHHEIIVKPDAIEALQLLAWQYDEPFADPSSIPTYYVSKAAREHVTVILSGDGGDETFAGYNRYSNFLRFKRFDVIPARWRKLIFGIASNLLPFGMRGAGVLRHISHSSFERFAGMVTHVVPGYLENLLNGDIKRELKYSGENFDFLKQYFEAQSGIDELSRIQYVDAKTYLAEDILTKVDRASMLCSLETRAPLLDHEFLEYIAAMPSHLQLRNGEKKYILKKTMEKHLPQEILYRKKMGFNMPLSWFKDEFMDYSNELLLSKKSRERGFFNNRYIERLLKVSRRPGMDLSANTWALVFFEQWCRNWLD